MSTLAELHFVRRQGEQLWKRPNAIAGIELGDISIEWNGKIYFRSASFEPK